MNDYPPKMKLRPIDAWPGAFTQKRIVSPFSATHTSTLALLDRELRMLDPKDSLYPPSTLQIAMRESDFRVDGMPKANARVQHPGIILTIEPRNRPRMSFPVDTFTRWQDNLRGIAMGMERLRALERWGIVRTDEQYRGWQAIEAQAAPRFATADLARRFLLTVAVSTPGETFANDHDLVRRARRVAHPDHNGGDQSQWNDVEKAASVLQTS